MSYIEGEPDKDIRASVYLYTGLKVGLLFEQSAG